MFASLELIKSDFSVIKLTWDVNSEYQYMWIDVQSQDILVHYACVPGYVSNMVLYLTDVASFKKHWQMLHNNRGQFIYHYYVFLKSFIIQEL